MKVILLGATFATGNMGIGALTAGSIRATRESFPETEIFLLGYGEERVGYVHLNRTGTCRIIVLNRDAKNTGINKC